MGTNHSKHVSNSYIKIFLLLIFILILVFAAVLILHSKKPENPPAVIPPENQSSEAVRTSYLIPDTPHIYQMEKYPNGCESVTTVMALNFAGVDITTDEFINRYLPMSQRPFDPYKTYGGNPRDGSGFGCYAPVIMEALGKILPGTSHSAEQLELESLDNICRKYVDNDIPVIIWATQNMAEPFNGAAWEFEGRSITWIRPEHCLLLVGYDEDNYIFSDPMRTESLTYYPKSAVEIAYKALSSQAIVIK